MNNVQLKCYCPTVPSYRPRGITSQFITLLHKKLHINSTTWVYFKIKVLLDVFLYFNRVLLTEIRQTGLLEAA